MDADIPSQAQVIERLHLAFLDVLHAHLSPARYVLKGGTNLRYFFGSPRYSEDVDIDAVGMEGWKLEESVDKVLASPALAMLLRGGRVSIADLSKPKQTETTQRWKLAVTAPGHREPIRTKIEFSHRPDADEAIVESVPDHIVAPYALRGPTLQHYTAPTAIRQKAVALALRTATQARDIFDLDLLIRGNREAIAIANIDAAIRADAIARAMAVPFAAFRDQVLPFLEPTLADLYDEHAWNQMRGLVVTTLEDTT